MRRSAHSLETGVRCIRCSGSAAFIGSGAVHIFLQRAGFSSDYREAILTEKPSVKIEIDRAMRRRRKRRMSARRACSALSWGGGELGPTWVHGLLMFTPPMREVPDFVGRSGGTAVSDILQLLVEKWGNLKPRIYSCEPHRVSHQNRARGAKDPAAGQPRWLCFLSCVLRRWACPRRLLTPAGAERWRLALRLLSALCLAA
jgi:hypothetical protein